MTSDGRWPRFRAALFGANLGHSSLRALGTPIYPSPMPRGLKRSQQSPQPHFVTFTCYHRRIGFDSPEVYDLFVRVLENMRRRFVLLIYGYGAMPEHVHLLLSEPERGLLAEAIPLPEALVRKASLPR
jgi:hypothetical protein